MIRTSFIFFFTVLFYCSVISQSGINNPNGTEGMAMGMTGVTSRTQGAAITNPAGLGFVNSTGFLLFGQQRFTLNDLQFAGISASLPTSSGTFGLAIQYFGNESLNEQKLSFSFGRKLMKNLSLGVGLDYFNTRIKEYGSAGIMSFNLGIQSTLFENIIVGAHVYNPLGQELNGVERLPTLFKFGVEYHPSEKVKAIMEVEKDIDLDPRIKLGIQYFIHPQLALRAGALTEPAEWSFGLGYLPEERLSIDASASYHQFLGWSPGFGVSYRLTK